MRLRIIFPIFCVLFFTGRVSLQATPSTHIWAPSTDIQPFKVAHLTSDMYVPAAPDKNGAYLAPVINTGLTVGFLPFEKVQGEIGFDHIAVGGLADKYPMYFNMKLAVPEKSFGAYFPAVAAGVYGAGTKKDVSSLNIVFAKTALTMGPAGRLSLGFYTGNEKLLLNAQGEKDNSGLLFAWERLMPEISDKLWLCAEYQGGKNAFGTLNFGFAWALSGDFAVLFGYNIYNNPNLPPTYTVQTDVNF